MVQAMQYSVLENRIGDMVRAFFQRRSRISHRYAVSCRFEHAEIILSVAEGEGILLPDPQCLTDSGEGGSLVIGKHCHIGRRSGQVGIEYAEVTQRDADALQLFFGVEKYIEGIDGIGLFQSDQPPERLAGMGFPEFFKSLRIALIIGVFVSEEGDSPRRSQG